jgi:hypothetical protein
MTAVNVMLKLPEALVEEAKAAGILTDERVAQLLEAELERKRRARTFFDDVAQLHALEPTLTQGDIDAEFAAYRKEKAASRKA